MRRVALVLAAMGLALLLASGVALAVNKIGTNGPDTLIGTNGSDNLLGRGGNDELFGSTGSDNLLGGLGKDILYGDWGGDKRLAGGPGNDVVFGGDLGPDIISGGPGNDLLEGGPDQETSKDFVSAGDGNDVVVVFSKRASKDKDLVTCGGGFDWVEAGTKDVVAADCERVADRASEFQALGRSIPQSFWEGLPPPFNRLGRAAN